MIQITRFTVYLPKKESVMKSLVVMIVSALMCLGFLSTTARAADEKPAEENAPSAKLLATRHALENLWTDHIFWVRAAVVATHDKNQAADEAAEKQVVANAHAIADAVVPFYGKEAGEQLFKLLAGHWGAIKAYLQATDSHNDEAAQTAQKDLYDNAHAIAKFLSSANPNWPEDVVSSMLVVHAAHHIAQINDIYGGKYDQEADNWAQMRTHMNTLGDALANGLAKQFPSKF
jgi:hypothetical protein